MVQYEISCYVRAHDKNGMGITVENKLEAFFDQFFRHRAPRGRLGRFPGGHAQVFLPA